MRPLDALIKKINIVLAFLVLILLGYYVYQTVSISSGRVGLVNLKKEFLERKDDLSAAADLAENDVFEPAAIAVLKEKLRMAEIEKFDYIIVGPSEFALIENNSNGQRQ